MMTATTAEKPQEIVVRPELPTLFGLRNASSMHRFRVGSTVDADGKVLLEVQNPNGTFRSMNTCPVEELFEHLVPARTYEMDEWAPMLSAWHLGLKTPVSEPIYWEFLEVLPPISMQKRVTLISGVEVVADFLFAEGAERISAFYKDRLDGRYYVEYTNLYNR